MTSAEVVTRDSTKPKQRKRAYDWEAIKAAYIEGLKRTDGKSNDPEEREWLSLDEVARRFSVLPSTVRKRSADERWPEQRAAYQARVAHSRRQRRILSLSKEAVDFDGKALSAAKLGITMVTARLGEIARDAQAQAARRAEADRRAALGLVVDPEDYATVIDARELDTLARAGTQFTSLARMALGEDATRHEHSGIDGAPIEVEVDATHSVKEEMRRDDPARMKALLDGLERAGLLQEADDDDIIDGDIEDEDDE